MKTTLVTKIKIICAAILMSTVVISCTIEDDDVLLTDNEEVEQAIDIATSGSWQVSSYKDDGQNQTSDYNGYIFTFQTSGILIATNGTTEVEGTWSIANGSNSDSSSSDGDIEFNILFNVSEDNDFDDLSDDWDIVTITNTTISLIDISGNDGSIDELVFTKI